MRPSETSFSPQSSDTAASDDSERDVVRDEVVVAIPARWGSTRLPGKPLITLAGRPMIEHVYRRASAARGTSRVVVLTDDQRIADVVEGFGGEAMMTPEDCPSGTDRIAWAARGWSRARAVINVQGDEPLIDPRVIERLAAALTNDADLEMATFAAPLDPDRHKDPNAVKVVTTLGGDALYFSRAAIPFDRSGAGGFTPWLHLGLYAYRRDVLLRLASLEPTPLEKLESLEQLRALEHGIRIRVLHLDRAAEPGVDTEDDLLRTEQLMQAAADESSASNLSDL